LIGQFNGYVLNIVTHNDKIVFGLRVNFSELQQPMMIGRSHPDKT